MFFDTRFYANDGHTGLWNALKEQLLGTLTDGTGVGYRNWGPGTYGYAGWMRVSGVVAPFRPGTVPVVTPVGPTIPAGNYVFPGNPLNVWRDPNHLLGVGGGIKDFVFGISEGVRMQCVGYPTTNEQDAWLLVPGGAARKIIVQQFERVRIIYDAAEPHQEWRVRVPLLTETISLVDPASVTPTPVRH